jgi:hypothetical protein
VEIFLHAYVSWVLYRGGWSASRPGRFTCEERAAGIHWIGDGMGPRAGGGEKSLWPRREPNRGSIIVVPAAFGY